MAERRMFSKTIIDSDAFLSMPLSAQALYFHLVMRADDDGFVNGSQRILRTIGACEEDIQPLLENQLLIAFDSGVMVIRHWKLHNSIRKDRYTDTIYQSEKRLLLEDKRGVYSMMPKRRTATKCQPDDNQMSTKCQPDDNQMSTNWQQNGNQMTPQDRIDKDRIDKDNISIYQSIDSDGEKNDEKNSETASKKIEYAPKVILTESEFKALGEKYGSELAGNLIRILSQKKAESGKNGKHDYRSLNTWVYQAYLEQKSSKKPFGKNQEPFDLNDFTEKPPEEKG